MPYTEINAQVSAADVQAIKDAFALIATKLPFLVSLTDAERKRLRKTGVERLSFVENAAQAAVNNANILPASFDAAKFKSAVTLFQVMTDIHSVSEQMASKIDDTRMNMGVQSMSGASDIYGYVKVAAKKTPGLKPLAAQMGVLNQKAVNTRRAKKNAKMAAAAAK